MSYVKDVFINLYDFLAVTPIRIQHLVVCLRTVTRLHCHILHAVTQTWHIQRKDCRDCIHH